MGVNAQVFDEMVTVAGIYGRNSNPDGLMSSPCQSRNGGCRTCEFNGQTPNMAQDISHRCLSAWVRRRSWIDWTSPGHQQVAEFGPAVTMAFIGFFRYKLSDENTIGPALSNDLIPGRGGISRPVGSIHTESVYKPFIGS
jgi:hypothetical protein